MPPTDTYPRKPAAAKTLSFFVPAIARAVFRAHGFPSAALLTGWADIAGADLASFTRPERIVWPRRREADEPPGETAAGSRPKRGATLVLRAEGPRALEVQFMAMQLLERLNTHFGYGAITELRIVQAPLGKPGRKTAVSPGEPADPVAVQGIENDDLQRALGRLGAHVITGGEPQDTGP